MGCFSSKTADHGPIRPQPVDNLLESQGKENQASEEKAKKIHCDESRVHTVPNVNSSEKKKRENYSDGKKLEKTGIIENKDDEVVRIWLDGIFSVAKSRIYTKV